MAKQNQRIQLLKLSEEERANYMRIALALQGVSVDINMALRLIMTYERIGKLGGNFSIQDSVEIDNIIEQKFKEQEQKLKEQNK